MNSSATNFLLLTLCSILISQFPSPINSRTHSHYYGVIDEDPGLIDQVCKFVDEAPVECLNILKSNKRILHAHDFLELSTAILEMAVKKSKEGQSYLKEVLKTKNVPAIQECANHDYDEVVELFSKALDEVKDNPGAAGNDALSAREGSKACDSAVAAARVGTPEIFAVNHRTWLLSEIAYIATEKLVN